MKKKILSIFTIMISISLIALPKDIDAKTITDFENEVAKYTADLQAKKDKVAKNDAEVAQIKKKISEIEAQIKTAEAEIEKLKQEIEESNKKIAKKIEESKRIMKYFQVVNGENSYLEYVFDATSITDMIYRMSVVEQLAEYNQNVVKELNDLITENNKKKSELEAKNKELNNLEKSLQDQKERINADTEAIKAGMPTVEQQIKSAKEQVAQFKKMGCGKNEDINACSYRYYQSQSSSSGGIGSIPSTNGFYRPMENGYVTQSYKGRAHMGVDLSSSDKSIMIYPIASGQVTATYTDPDGALVVKIRHNYNGRFIYSTYAHQRNFKVSSGQYVSHTTGIGNMGSTGNSTGPHLHLEITSCDWKSEGGGCTWSQYKNSTYNPTQFVSFPSRWTNR